MGEGKRKRASVWMLWFLIFNVCVWGLVGCSGKEENEKTVSSELEAVSKAESESVLDSSEEEQAVAETTQIPQTSRTPLETEPVNESDLNEDQKKTDSERDSESETEKSERHKTEEQQTESKHDSERQEETEADPDATVSIENYLVNGEWRKLKDILNMQPAESGQFGDIGEAYEIDGFYITWSSYMMEDEGSFTMENSGSTSVNIYGVKVGDTIVKADSALKDNGWTSLNDGRQYIVIFNGRNIAIDFRLDDNQAITGWYLCNWPEGDFSENFVGLENQQINGVPAQINVYEGEYKYELAHTGLDITEYYTVIVENVTDDSFDFTIYYADDLADTRDVVFRTHTAIFEGDGTYARYHGTEYNLEFTFPNDRNTLPDAVDMQISGYEPVEGLTFCNHAIPGHEFS